jgi:Lipocalin-like domain
MRTLKWLGVLVWFLVAAQPSFADDREKILGIWRLVSFEVEFQATGEREHIRGKNPTGFIIFTAEGRMMVVLTNEGRKAPKTDQDRADPLNSMVAHTGMYRIEGDKWITKVDVSGNPALVGTEQARFFRVDGDRLQEITQWTLRPEKGMGRTVITWERAK